MFALTPVFIGLQTIHLSCSFILSPGGENGHSKWSSHGHHAGLFLAIVTQLRPVSRDQSGAKSFSHRCRKMWKHMTTHNAVKGARRDAR
jgi:hypothetical protein